MSETFLTMDCAAEISARSSSSYPPNGLEIEFVAGSGKTRALLTLREDDVRAAADGDLISVRPFDQG